MQVSAETTQRVMQAAAHDSDPWEALVVGADAFLDASAARRCSGSCWSTGRRCSGGTCGARRTAITRSGCSRRRSRRAIDAGRLIDQPARALAHVLIGALDEAAMVVARADDPEQARAEMGQTVRRLLEGLRGPTT